MCYFRTKTLCRHGTHIEIQYLIEWNEDELRLDIAGAKDIFTAKCLMGSSEVEIGKAKTVADAQRLIDQYHGDKVPAHEWIQYNSTLHCNNRKYKIYETWDSSARKYIVSVSRDNGKNIYKYSEVSENIYWEALSVTGNNLASEIIEIAQEDVRSGILDRYIDNCNNFVVDEYITDGTQPLLKEIWQRQGSRKTFPVILYLFLKALTDEDGTLALPHNFANSGEIFQCLRGSYNNESYEICTRLRIDGGIWRFAGESLYVNGINFISTSRCVDGNYLFKLRDGSWNYVSIPYNQSLVAHHLPQSFHKIAKTFLNKNPIKF